jgi:hypothetical protein
VEAGLTRFKQFQGSGADLERAVNRWMEDFEPDITQMAQTVSADGGVTVSFIYEESFRGQELRLDNEHGMLAAARQAAEAELPPEQIAVRATPPEGSTGPGVA